MGEREGYTEVLINEPVYREFLDRIDDLDATPLSSRRAGRCGMDVIFGPDGDIQSMNCSGGCGFFDRLFGRTCQIRGKRTPGGGARFFCTCTGGWLDRILGTFGR